MWDFHNFLWENRVFIPKDGGTIRDNIQKQVFNAEKKYKKDINLKI